MNYPPQLSHPDHYGRHSPANLGWFRVTVSGSLNPDYHGHHRLEDKLFPAPMDSPNG